MPSIENATVGAELICNALNALNAVTGSAPLNLDFVFNFTNGTGANKANQIFSDKRTLAASATENLDLAGVLTDAFGAVITFTKIKALLIKADPANVNDVVIGAAGSNPWIGMMGATSVLNIKPGGVLLVVAPDANGMAVVAATGDLLKVLNGGAGTGVTYTIAILGEA